MKKESMNISVKWFLLMGLAAISTISCQKHYDPNFTLPRQFKPGDISIATTETTATLTWKASLFASPSTNYTVQVSRDTSFVTNVYNKVVNVPTVVVTDTVLQPRLAYYARVKANADGSTVESGWVKSGAFSITGEQIFLTLTASNIIDNAVLLKWRTTPGLVKIVMTPVLSGTPFTVNLTPADLTAEQKIISGLMPATAYSAEIFDAVKSKGYLTFTTAATISGNIIDLRGITGRPSVLADTLPLIADASTVILKRGETYNIAAALSLGKSVKIVSGSDLTNPSQAIISLPANFNIVAGSTIAYLDFQDVSLIATDYTAKYVFNINAACTITRISFDGCRIEKMRGVTRLQTATISLTNYVINNCIIDSISNYGLITIDAATCKADNISIKNSTIYKTERGITSTKQTAGSTSVVIDNCTFNEAPLGNQTGSFIVDYSAFNVTNGISITNCIFGKGKPNGASIDVRDIRVGTSTTVTSSNNYITSDHTVVASPLTPVINYSGTSFVLWQDPLGGNFRFADNTFPGRSTSGDPRWR